MSQSSALQRAERLVTSLTSQDGETRHCAYQDLLDIGRPALPAVRDGLKHEHWQVRRWCAMVLDRIADSESLRMLIPLLDDSHRLVRLWAVHSIACDQCKEGANPIDVVPLLIRRMRADRSVRVRRMAAAMLASHHSDPRAFRAFRLLLDGNADPKVQLHARFGLRGRAS